MNPNAISAEEDGAFIIAVAILWLIGAAVTTFFFNRHSANDGSKGIFRFVLRDAIFVYVLRNPLMLIVWPIVAFWMAYNRD